ncbi:hexosaminidase [Sediminihabitans luteus]|uniref:beta-N-acetylhexosaminidase n=1 Tax=Sediminihabitans luteus TaxID=1138585 RepID=A0A2M9CE30_9CELL|nr:family 20 glycosylhydrolase [Sediminihabitans luteus]PJJ70122.1 hexosaminidase [Sediminihabitans luteus]GIJ00577.1 beta-N-acetylhexosaminidase [Sediminihabitans luteus]
MLSIIPQPLQVTHDEHAAVFPLGSALVLTADTDAERSVGRLAAQRLGRAAETGPLAHVTPGERDLAAPTVVLVLDPAAGPEGSTHPERYSLVVTGEEVVVSAAEPAGLQLGVSTLRQLVTTDAAGRAVVPAVVVHDAPRYGWRGLSFDLSRHFFRVEQLERVVDLLVDYKLNVLHLHLTDDQGWRIESPSRPELAKEGSTWEIGDGPGGYLSVLEFDQLQDYAAERFVAIVPEIDVPGHINAATHVYGDLNPDGKPTDEYRGMEVGFSKLTYDLPATEPFLRDVFSDIAAITRGEHVHIGGDEVFTMDPAEFAKFVELCERVVLDAGKKVVAWQEAAHADVRPGTLIQFWDTNKKDHAPFLRAATEEGARFIMSPGNRAYLDMKYTADYALGQDWAGLVEVHDAYDWDPETVIAGMPAEAIEGVEAAIWTETLSTLDEVFEMLLPRLPAVAEVAWTDPARKDWASFRARVAVEAASWRREGRAFHASPQVVWS